ncbi:Glyoxalase/Bleomycin resistance protein/Dihydroxybiphenyl dioxygenase [Dactylonectria macrodidyma]|uniref:Glyoxalase/Bleomycin resistance protein/Dihydroxybiphenyl dioxygenase n=1 Tax=Dactylonectria macrodidyma TaxID=307937 RepID=A0A9P9EE69_9HYPO|nr:Glyoxalase/Bleomycin resistance protein/Dihydroxybiphenyl dioxygenase [Dactylonectria macrodidyma]
MASIPEIHNSPSKIQLERISHVYFEHPNLNKFDEFAKDFGFVQAYEDPNQIVYRGYGRDPYCYVARKSSDGMQSFGGGAFVAQTQADFDKAASMKGAVVSDLSPLPGGGRQVKLKSPCGFPFHVVYGQEERTLDESAPSAQVDYLGPLNGSFIKNRLGQFQRFHSGPAMVHKLGHYGFIVANWLEEVSWYTDNFNFVPSDVQHAPDNAGVDVVAFMHLDLGERFSDHHSMFFSRAPPGEHDRMHHSSFEVEDFDTQALGHEWLASKGHKPVWGLGRHILGSQIFDYWRDPSGFTIEHYADGDLVNVHTGTKRSMAGPLAVWGPEFPKEMTEDGTIPTAA